MQSLAKLASPRTQLRHRSAHLSEQGSKSSPSVLGKAPILSIMCSSSSIETSMKDAEPVTLTSGASLDAESGALAPCSLTCVLLCCSCVRGEAVFATAVCKIGFYPNTLSMSFPALTTKGPCPHHSVCSKLDARVRCHTSPVHQLNDSPMLLTPITNSFTSDLQ